VTGVHGQAAADFDEIQSELSSLARVIAVDAVAGLLPDEVQRAEYRRLLQLRDDAWRAVRNRSADLRYRPT
jgi:hypothetical protein